MIAKLVFHQLRPEARLPTQAHGDDAGFDLTLAEDLTLTAESPIGIGLTGLAVTFPPGWYGLVVSRSGLAAEGTVVANAPGVIDPGYRGEIKMVLQHHFHGESWVNMDSKRSLKAGWRVAQLLLVEFPIPWPPEVVWWGRGCPDHQRNEIEGNQIRIEGNQIKDPRGVRGIGSTSY